MTQTAPAADLVGDLLKKGSITADDVLALRRDLFSDGLVDRGEAEAIFALDRGCGEKDIAWQKFYVEALTDYLVWKAEPRKYVDDANAQFLIENIVHDGKVDSEIELELLVNVIHWSSSCPDRLVMFVLEAVRDSVLNPTEAVYGGGRQAGAIGAVDVAIVRKVLYAVASAGSFTITQEEAELLFALNNATVAAANDDSWQDLFVKAVANYLMFPQPAPSGTDAAEALRREAWLEERRGTAGTLLDVGRSVGSFSFMAAWEALDLFGTKAAEEEAARELAETREAMIRERIDAAEAQWLVNQIDADGTLHDNELALLQFIKSNAPMIDPKLEALFAKTGL